MDFNEIKSIVINGVKTFFLEADLLTRMKEALRLPYAKTYIALSIFFTFIFFFVTYPYELLIRNKISNMKGGMISSISFADMDFSIIGTTTLDRVTITLRSGNEITIKSADLDIAFNPITLYIKKDIKGSFQLNGLKYQSESTTFTANIEGNIFLDFDSFNRLPRRGTLKIMGNNSTLKLDNLKLPEGFQMILPTSFPLMNIKSILINADLAGQKLNIRRAAVFGEDLKGSIDGNIALSKRIPQSRLDVKIMIDVNSKALKEQKEFLSEIANDSGNLVIPLKGSLMRPRPDFSSVTPSREVEPGETEPGEVSPKSPELPNKPVK